MGNVNDDSTATGSESDSLLEVEGSGHHNKIRRSEEAPGEKSGDDSPKEVVNVIGKDVGEDVPHGHVKAPAQKEEVGKIVDNRRKPTNGHSKINGTRIISISNAS